MMKLVVVAALLGATAFVGPAEAKGCIKGALIGGAAGHMAGHGKLGAAAGCVIGHHEANKQRQPATTGSVNQNQNQNQNRNQGQSPH